MQFIKTYGKMTRLAARVASATSTGSTNAKRRAVSLDMAKALAMIALLRCCRLSVLPSRGPHFLGPWFIWGARTFGRTRQRAPVGFMPCTVIRPPFLETTGSSEPLSVLRTGLFAFSLRQPIEGPLGNDSCLQL